MSEKITVRCKMVLTSEKRFNWGNGRELGFAAQYDSSIPEDMRFQEATPSGQMTIMVDNPKALEALKLGKSFYLDLIEVPE